MKVAGFCSGHDCSYAILKDGIPVLHNELERFTREKEPLGDSIKFMFDTYDDFNDIQHFAHCFDTHNGGIEKRYPDTFEKISRTVSNNGGNYFIPGHHESHAANAFFSSNFDEALIVTIDGGGRDYGINKEEVIATFTAWEGTGTKVNKIQILPGNVVNIGVSWTECTKQIFGLSGGYPKGNQAGTVMAMACMGDKSKYWRHFYDSGLRDYKGINFPKLKQAAALGEQEMFDIAAGLQEATERITRSILDTYVERYPHKNLCLSGGVVLNSVMVGKMYDWYPSIENIYVCPVPYDAGLSIGAAQYVYHHELGNPRVYWQDNASPYLGTKYSRQQILNAIKSSGLHCEENFSNDAAAKLLSKDDNIISVFAGGSESGRRALGNRSILADPRSPKMKDIINEKVKHRQWFRPFAPSVLRECVSDWFEKDIDCPYMTAVIKFKESVVEKVPAVVHLDGTGRLQTVTEKDNPWYYRFIKKFKEYSGVPIVLNTSFNDREPIVETPEHAISCFSQTDIDYLYFADEELLVSK
jgi:carbamoyltransferase